MVPNWLSGCQNYAVLAMAYHRLGQSKKAKEALGEAGRVIDRGLDVLLRGPAGTLPMRWYNWLECWLLYREAKTLIDGSPPADDPRWHVARANAFIALGDQKKANESYAKAAKLAPHNGPLWTTVGIAQYRSGEHAGAIQTLTHALSLNGANASDFLYLAMAHWQRGRKDKARQWYQAAVLRMQLGLPFRWGGTAAELDGLRREAELLMGLDKAPTQTKSDDLERYSRIIAAQPEAAWAYQLRGQIYRRVANTQKADPDARRASELLTRNLPTGPDALEELKRAAPYYMSCNSWDMVIVVYSKAIELKDDELWFHQERGWANIVLEQFRKAVKDYTKVIALNPQRGNYYARRGYAHLRLSEHDKALADYDKVLELNSDYSGDGWSRYCAIRLGTELSQLKDDKAVAAFLKVTGLDAKNASTWNNLAWFYATSPDLKLRDAEMALRFAKQAVKIAQKQGTYWNTLGAAHYRSGNWKDAIAVLDKSMELRKGGDSFDWFFLAMAHWKLGDKEKARTRFDQAVQWMDKHQPADEELRRFRAEAAELLGIKDGKK
jgi:tetratricopeptide (TPR) repeat protein